MKTVSYYLINNNESTTVVEQIRDSIPCFISIDDVEPPYKQVTFIVREEDLKYIEKILAPII